MDHLDSRVHAGFLSKIFKLLHMVSSGMCLICLGLATRAWVDGPHLMICATYVVALATFLSACDVARKEIKQAKDAMSEPDISPTPG